MVALRTGDFPQADRLGTVARVPLAVASGLHSDKEIEEFLGLSSLGRQGRYYRQAAHLLGLIRNHQNYAELTDAGAEYAALSEGARGDFIALRVAQLPLFKLAARFVHDNTPSIGQFRDWLREIYPGEPGTADRRETTIRNWLIDSGLVRLEGDSLHISQFWGTVATSISGRDLPAADQEKNALGLVTYEVDLQKLERANLNHQRLVDCTAARLFERGVQPIQNGVIDLYGELGSDRIIFEMKTVHEQNYGSQIRKAVSQLYEYRFVHEFHGSRLCIVTNALPGFPAPWIESYLADDREIAVLQTPDFLTLMPLARSQDLIGPF